MAQAPVLSPELTKLSISLARALSAAARNWALYPPDHPSVQASLKRLADAIEVSVGGAAFTFGVTPQTLLVAGVPLPEDQPVAETARLLHDRDVLQLTFLGSVSSAALQSLLQVLSTPADDLRAAGGPTSAFYTYSHGNTSIAIEQIDYEKILEDRQVGAEADHRHDDVWRSVVNQVVAGRAVFDPAQQQRLLEISANANEIMDLAAAVMAPKVSADGSPLITTQAATVLAVFRHLASIVNVMEPERLADAMRNIVAATARLDPHVVLQIMQSEDVMQEAPIVEQLAASFDDEKAAKLLATALSRNGMASARLAQVFDTIAPDDERKQRVLTMTRSMLTETDFGKGGQFKAAWQSMEELLLSYNEKPYVSAHYQSALAGAGERGDILAARDLPPEWAEMVDTLGQDNVRSLSVLLITDLLRIEETEERAAEIAADMVSLAEDLLFSGAFDDALLVASTLKESADRANAVAPAACRAALTTIGESMALREAAALLGELEEKPAAIFADCCVVIGPSAVRALEPALQIEHETTGSNRAFAIVRRLGAPAVPQLSRLVDDQRWFVQRNAAGLLGATRSADAVAPLQALLRRHDARVLRPAVAALAGIDDPSAARAIQTVLRAVTGEARTAVVEALVAEKDPRVVPMLARIIAESDPFGADHQTVLDALGAVKAFADERAVAPVAAMMRRKRFFAWKKSRAFKAASVEALRAIGTARAQEALVDAAKTGDRLLKKILKETRA